LIIATTFVIGANFAPKYPPIIKVVAIINANSHSTYPAL
jgi:hypothetical protein